MPQSVLHRLRSANRTINVELRPPRSDLSGADSMDVWIDMYHAIQRLIRRESLVFLTDNAVGQSEEENLAHLVANLGADVDRSWIVPFLTTKHSLQYCGLYAQRAVSYAFDALTVLGGDASVGPPRCLPHAFLLRREIRGIVPELTLGGWANPNADVRRQVDYMLDPDYTAEFYLTQVVSHYGLDDVERFLDEAARRGVEAPGVFGVFYYRSANQRTLERLGEFFPVPAEGLTRDFERGMSAMDICVETIRRLFDVGVRHVYLSNLGVRSADRLYREITSRVNA